MKKIPVKIVKIINDEGIVTEIDPKDMTNIHSSGSVNKYADTFEISLDNSKGKYSNFGKKREEIEIWLGYEETGVTKVLGGYVERALVIVKDGKHTVKIQGRSFFSFLLDNRISGKFEYKEGFSQVLREALKNTPLKGNNILNTQGKGTVILRNIPFVDLFRQLAEEINWTFKVDHNKVVHFNPITPPKHSGIKITDKDIKEMTLIRETKK